MTSKHRTESNHDPAIHEETPIESGMSGAIRAARAPMAHLVVFSGAINLMILAVPIFMIQVFDRVLLSSSMSTLAVLGIGAVMALLVMSALDVVRGRIIARNGLKFEHALSKSLLRDGSSAVLNDLAKIRNFLSGANLSALLDVPWIPLFVGVIFILNPTLGWLAVAGIIMLGAVAAASELWTRGALLKSRAADRDASISAGAIGRNGNHLSVSVSRDGWLRHWSNISSRTAVNRLEYLDKVHAAAVLGRFVRLSLQIALIATAAALVIASEITPGALVAASVIASRALGPIERGQDLWRNLVDVWAAFARLKNASGRITEVVAQTDSDEPTKVDVRGVTWFPDQAREPVFRNVSFRIAAGEMVGLTGPSSTGKSMLAKMLVGLLPPTQGRIRLNEIDVEALRLSNASNSVAYVSQSPELLPGTVFENISGFTDSPREEIEHAAKLAGVFEEVRKLPRGFETPITGEDALVSKGIAQRMALARAYLARPRFLVLDEPYTYLDNLGVASLLAALRVIRERGTAIFVVSQRPSVLADCTRVIVMQDGIARSVERATRTELRVLDGNRDHDGQRSTRNRVGPQKASAQGVGVAT